LRVEIANELLYLLVARIDFEHALVPAAGGVEIARFLCDVAEVAQRDQILGVEPKGRVENLPRLIEAAGFEERLGEHDVSADVTRLLREVCPAQGDRLIHVPGLAVLIR
jgi:hypothetical protein